MLKLSLVCPAQVLAGALALAYCLPAAAVTIHPVFEASITSASNAATIETVINAAAGDIGALFSNPGTVIINFGVGTGNFLGETSTSPYGLSYSDYTSLLAFDAAAHPTNTILSSAVANLSRGNDANGAKPIVATSAQLRVALGLSEALPCCSGADGTIMLNSALLDFTLGSVPIFNGHNTIYDALGTAEHEIDEVLGGGGQGSVLNGIADGIAVYRDYYGVLDLYRYAAAHTPSFTTSGSATSYLSVNGGVSAIVAFNQNSSGDYADFGPNTVCANDPAALGGPVGIVQDAFSCPNTNSSITLLSPEAKMLEAIGYDPVVSAVPEPGLLACSFIGVLGLFGVSRRSRRYPLTA
jgi:hypothetical protein